MRMTIGFVVGIAVVFAFAGVPASASAQRCEECDTNWWDGTQWHWFSGAGVCGGFAAATSFPTCAACGGTSDCHTEPDTGPCHVACDPAETFASQEGTLKGLLTAVRQKHGEAGNPFHLLLAELRHNPNMSYSPARATIRVTDCIGNPIAEFRLSRLSNLRLRLALS
ncbi:MAG TPA: hypothetical protein VK929_03905 [Longimicrobiales bacterium]|nr:hypothetical protein [Longimicrobiales bacterium]